MLEIVNNEILAIKDGIAVKYTYAPNRNDTDFINVRIYSNRENLVETLYHTILIIGLDNDAFIYDLGGIRMEKGEIRIYDEEGHLLSRGLLDQKNLTSSIDITIGDNTWKLTGLEFGSSPYPVVITKKEFEKATGADLDSYFSAVDMTSDKFLKDVAFYFYQGAIYSAGQKHFVDRIINEHKNVLAPQIKDILIKVAEYMLHNLDENIALFSGLTATENGGVDIKADKDIISKILPPNIMTYVMNITPSIVYAGGYRNV